MNIDRNHLYLSSNWLMMNVALQWWLAAVDAIQFDDAFCWIDRDLEGYPK